MRPNRIVLLVIASVVGLFVGLWLHESDEEKVRAAVDAIVEGANQGPFELTRALEKHAIEDVTVTVTDLPAPLVGRGAIVAAASGRGVPGGKLSFRTQKVDVVVEGSSARVNADLVATLQLGLRGMSRTRSGVALFEKVDGRFLMVSAEAGSER